jgi:hypothetical protein
MGDEEESLADRQENEVEALKAIYDKDFEVRIKHLRVIIMASIWCKANLTEKEFYMYYKMFHWFIKVLLVNEILHSTAIQNLNLITTTYNNVIFFRFCVGSTSKGRLEGPKASRIYP